MDKIITISKDFTEAPGARYITDGPKSGEEFYTTLLEPSFEEVVKADGQLTIDLDNTWGYASSFISGSFGELSTKFGTDVVLKHLKFISKDDPMLIGKIEAEIKEPSKKR